MQKSKYLLFLVGLSIATTGNASTNDCPTDLIKNNDKVRIDEIDNYSALAEKCQDYYSYSNLGLIYSHQGRGLPDEEGQDNYDKALDAFDKAQSIATRNEDQSVALEHYADVLLEKGYKIEALSILKKALKLHPNPPYILNEKTATLDKELRDSATSKDFILRSSGLSTFSSNIKLLTIRPAEAAASPKTIDLPESSVDISIHFEFDSAKIDPDSQAALLTLANTLADPKFRNKKFILVGHTDSRGEGEYNLNLSKRRAQQVYRELERINPELANKMQIKGAGEDELLYSGDTELMHWLNRRLEVVIK
ncbi:OmpA family protein [Ketobacter sp.]|uniref:OmpA family protein n=1 Tax=Ketobacter sp. TaxID=2083498 RepID=UPI0025C442D7|nr:OmpA family protein [Ketobacter sp.]